MRNSIHQFLNERIAEATTSILKEDNIDPNIPLEYYADKIMLKTLDLCATHLLKKDSLRKSEKKTLLELQKNIQEKIDLSIIERNLINNLSNIKPIYGELFGTDRGPVYKTFQMLKKWPCFTWHARLYYKEQHQQHLSKRFSAQSEKISIQQQQVSAANHLIQDHEKTNDALAQRAASQFVTIQQLKMELASAKKIIEQQAEELRKKEQEDAEPLVSDFSF